MIQQGFKKQTDTPFQRAELYYTVLSVINGFNLTTREIQLVAFTAVKGNMTNGNVRNEFCELYGTSVSTINNIISKLKNFGIFVKEDSKTRVNKDIVLDFSNDIQLIISLTQSEE